MRRLTRRLLVAAGAIAFGYAIANVLTTLRQQGDPVAGPGPSVATTQGRGGGLVAPEQGTTPTGDGNALVLSMLRAFELRQNIAAHVRQVLVINGEQLGGDGTYWQQGRLNQRRTCWQVQTAAAGESMLFRQVLADGRYLWTDKWRGEARTVTRIDTTRLVRELHADELPGEGEATEESLAVSPQLLARGGMSQLAADLARCFDFAPPTSAAYEGKPVLEVVGKWRPEVLAKIWPGLTVGGSGAGWPAHLPHDVLLQIGAADYFPYVVEYRGAGGASAPGLLVGGGALARYEFYDVQFTATMPPNIFDPPQGGDWKDVTADAVARLRADLAPVETAAVAPVAASR